MSEDIKPESSSIPPRVTIKIPGQSGEVVETPTATTLPAAKKKTARISLDQVSAEPGAAAAAPVSGVGVASKSIRLAPAMTGQVTIAPMTPVGKALGGMLSEDAKRTTSRIPLESILAEQGGKLPDSAPKTIKVKRPVLSTTPRVAGLPVESQAEVPAAPVAGEMSSKSQTARVDIAPEAIEPQQTQKKTIKIRRADGGAGDGAAAGRNISIARTEGAPAEVSAAGAGVSAPHWFFIVTAAAAAVTLCFMLYVLAAQAYPDLGWKVGV